MRFLRWLHDDQAGYAEIVAGATDPHQAPPTLRTPERVTDRPQISAPIYHQIPAELQARAQWVLWRYERKSDTWTKVPYQPNLSPAATSRPPTWSSFADAKAAYLARPDYFNGIGYVFSKDDPYCGADFDHCIGDDGQISSWAAAHLAALRTAGAYIEISVSGSGIHAITRATFGKGRKTSRGEIYDRGRFFTISGQALEPTPIGDGQATIDALRVDLGGSSKADTPTRDGTAGNGDRAALAAAHPPEEWEEARQLLRTKRDLLLRRAERATRREGTQGYFAARLLWPELHTRWPHIGLYRADGALDDSQARAVLARALYGRGFAFPEFVVIMSHHFAAYCLEKWGTREMWREELAALWHNAIEHTAYKPKTPAPAARPKVVKSVKLHGRASDHAALVERVYQLLLDHRAGAQAIVHTAELASTLDIHRVTLAGILAELRSAGRITTKRNGRYGGLIVSFPDVAIVATAAPELCATTAEIPIEAPAAIEETRVPTSKACVSSESHEPGYSSQAQHPAPRSLADAVRLAFDQVRVDHETGERQRITRKRLLLALAELGSWPTAAIERAIVAERQRRQRRSTDRYLAQLAEQACELGLEQLKRRAKSSACAAHAAQKRGDPRAWLKVAIAGIYAAEEARRQPTDPAPTTHELWAQVDQAAYLAARPAPRVARAARVCSPQPTLIADATSEGWALIERLQQRLLPQKEAY